ncbi:FAD/NAD(P)-binding domain-containing protein [Dendrothele bispora CBS 962.96]|uniref:FAD/NAD(P)-binding domain-containing protein n=1 Tax=Dendrothele bispora (strain CBS 962.96) TaxID=1314807 RepID=A0A4S8KVV4_DENBC|nr:FAD/NAD(P)-binding domain-containing protein [Dendrothele bispora CBS 962.96]
MSSPDFALPTLDHLQTTISPDLDSQKVVSEWFDSFASYAQSGDTAGVMKLFHPESTWRDMLALTWDFRTFTGEAKIKEFLDARLGMVKLNEMKVRKDQYLGLQKPFPDLAWVQFMFDFKVGDVGIGSGIGRLVPTTKEGGGWKAISMYTNLEDLQGFPEKTGQLRDSRPNHGLWVKQREEEVKFEKEEPTVLIVGGGHNGLDISTRLKMLGITSLVVEKNERVGDNWRNRYKALCLHDPVWYDHMPYLPFPSNWPVYSPSAKIADWLESFAHSMELNVWTSSTVTSASLNPSTQSTPYPTWTVHILSNVTGQSRTFTKVKHLIFATGFGSGEPRWPVYPGIQEFKANGGQVLHSMEHKLAEDHLGKKVVVVGACTSAHDIASDYYLHGIDVTMYQRSSTYIMTTKHGWEVIMAGLYSEDGPPTDIADRMNASLPHHFLDRGINQRNAERIAELDRPLLEDLKKVGFRLNMGTSGGGFSQLAWKKAGGYYLDVGASEMIVSGKIKLKNDSTLERFTSSGLSFSDGSTLPADVVVFATGFADTRGGVQKVIGEELGKKLKRIWGLDKEGEIHGAWRDLGVEGLWFMIGNFALSRFHSKHVALQIKAMEEGVFGKRYSLQEEE